MEKLLKLRYYFFIFISFNLITPTFTTAQGQPFLLLENTTDTKIRTGVYVAPPEKYNIQVKVEKEFQPSYMFLIYDDLFGGLNKTLQLKSTPDGFYEGTLNFEPSPSSPNSEGENKDNFYPRDYHFKRLEFKWVRYFNIDWISLETIDSFLWNNCLDKEPFKDGWLVHSKNERGETFIFVKDFYELNAIKGHKIQLPPLEDGKLYLPDSIPLGSIRYRDGWLIQCFIGPIKSYFWARDFATGTNFTNGNKIQCKLIPYEEIYSPNLELDMEVKVTPLADKLIKISNNTYAWRPIPELEGVKIVWDGKETELVEGEFPPIKLEKGPLKIVWKMRDDFSQIKPLAVHLNFFRPNKNGKTLLDSSGEYQYLDKTPPQSSWEEANWQEWVIPEDEFKTVGNNSKVEPGFRSGNYELKILATNFAANSIDKTFLFQVMGELPTIEISKVKRKGADSLEFNFSKKRVNTRFDVQVSTALTGPFHFLTRDVINNPPPLKPWAPYSAPSEERWEFFVEENQAYSANLIQIKEIVGIYKLPAKIYFKFRGIDEVDNQFKTEPIEIVLEKKDLEPPILTVEENGSKGIRIYDFGDFPLLRGSLKDKSPWGNQNICQLYLDSNGVLLSSVTLNIGASNLIWWTLPILESMESHLPNGNHLATLHAVDMDGNETSVPLNLNVDVIPFDLKISTPFYSRSESLDFRAQVKENSFLSLLIDGKVWFKDLYTGDNREILTQFNHKSPLKPGLHRAHAILKRNGESKELQFDVIIDPSPPQLEFVRVLETGENLLSIQEENVNISSHSILTLQAKGNDPDSAVTLSYAISKSIQGVEEQLNRGGTNLSENGTPIELPNNETLYCGVLVKDLAGNSSPLQIYPILYDTKPFSMQVQSVEQNLSERQKIWIHFKTDESEIVPARYDLAISTSSEGPWRWLTRNILENAPSKLPWSWNELLKEEEWQNLRKLDGKIVPLLFPIDKLKSALNIFDLPGKFNSAPLYFRVRTKDFAGNISVGPPQEFSLTVDKRAPTIEMEEQDYKLIDFDPRGGTLYGRVKDEPNENSTLQIELVKDEKVLVDIFTNDRLGGEFALSLPLEARPLLYNGTHSLKVVAKDVDGNRTVLPIMVSVDVKPFQIEVGDNLTQNLVRNLNSKYGSLELDFPVIPNSKVSLRVSGKELLKNFDVGPIQHLKRTFPLTSELAEGEHTATIQMSKNGQQASKLFRLHISKNHSKSKEMPSIFVQGGSGIVRVYDAGYFGGLSGTVQDNSSEGGGLTQIFLSKAGVILATTTIRTENNILSPWEMVIPESAKELLGQGEQNLILIAMDEDGNESQVEILANIDIKDLFIDIENPYYARSDLLYDRSKKSSLHIKAKVKENSELSLKIDGVSWANGIYTGARSEFEDRFETDFPLAEGKHRATLTLRRNKEVIKKEFDLIIDNAPPKIILEEEIPTYLKSQTLNLKGKVQSKTPLEHFTVSLSSAGEKMNSIPIDKQFNIQSGSFTIIISHLQENKEKPYQIELEARTIRGQEVFYTQEKGGFKSIPYFYVDVTPPKPPTLKVLAKTQEALYLEGNSEADPTLTIILLDSLGHILGKSPVYYQMGDEFGVWNRRIEKLSPGDYELYAYAQDLAGNRSATIGPEKVTVASVNDLFLGTRRSSKDVVVKNQWDLRFSPNGDGLNDTLLFNKEDLPVTIQQFRRGEIVKIITEQDNDRWDGKSSDGNNCEIDLYLAKTKTGREFVISLYR